MDARRVQVVPSVVHVRLDVEARGRRARCGGGGGERGEEEQQRRHGAMVGPGSCVALSTRAARSSYSEGHLPKLERGRAAIPANQWIL